MNTDEATQSVDSSIPAPPRLPSPTEILDHQKFGHPRNGKIAKLPKELRDELNQMLADGATGSMIIDSLAPRGISLNHENISNWREGGFQDWLQHQALRLEMNAESESASGLFAASDDETTFHHVVIRVAVTQIFQSLRKRKLNDDPANYTTLLKAL